MVDNLFGDKAYQLAGRQVLPLLVRQAQASCTIFYEELAEEIAMPNERNLNYPLGSIGVTLDEIAVDWGIDVPHIQSLVISKRKKHPGTGFDGFLEAKGFENLSSKQKRALLKLYYAEIYNFPYWDDVLAYCEIERANSNISEVIKEASRRRGGGEGAEHAKLKEYIRTHPHAVGLSETTANGISEYDLPSGNIADVIFKAHGKFQIVEVKPASSDVADLARGLFQCVKYKAVLEHLLRFEQNAMEVDVCLVLGATLPASLFPLRNCLGIRVLENLQP